MARKFQTLQAKVSKMDIISGNLADRLDNFLDLARINADDTCYIEKAVPVSQHDVVALRSLEELLSFSSDKPAIDWFTKNGVKF